MATMTAAPTAPIAPEEADKTALAKKVLLIGLDGATFTILDPLMQEGVMPFLRELARRGVRAPLRSVIPALTPPAWTSLMTGKRPGEHGVFDFFQKDSAESHYLRFASSQDIRSETIWSIASQNGKRVISLNFPLMFPAPAVNGYVVPGGWMPWRQLRLGCYPPGLFDQLKALPAFNARELALDMAFEEKAIEGCAPEEYLDWIALHMRRERRWFEILKHLMRSDPADLTAVLFDGVDKLQHLCWRFLDPACASPNPSPAEQEIADLCRAYFAQLDGLIEEAVALTGPDTAVVLVSDHGFGPTSDVFYLNTWLERHGYLRWALDAAPPDGAQGCGPGSDAESVPPAPQLGLGQIARHMHRLDWDHTVAYAATPSSNGIHIVTRKPDGSEGVPPHEYERLRRELRTGLLATRHPITGEPLVADVLTREEAFAGPYAALGPDLTLILADGGLVSILRGETPLSPRREVAGTHREAGIFLAAGAGLQRGVSLPELSIVDVAPLLLDCIGIAAPADMTGATPLSVLEPVAAHARGAALPPVSISAARVTVHSAAAGGTSADVFDAEAEAIMLKRLQALGYVE